MNGPETLSDYIRRVLHEKDLSVAEAARRSKRGSRRGISRTYLLNLKNNQSANPTTDKLPALALGLGVTIDDLLDILLPEYNDRFRLIRTHYANLAPAQQETLEPRIQSLEQEIVGMLV